MNPFIEIKAQSALPGHEFMMVTLPLDAFLLIMQDLTNDGKCVVLLKPEYMKLTLIDRFAVDESYIGLSERVRVIANT